MAAQAQGAPDPLPDEDEDTPKAKPERAKA
jgi:hypothetical protein